MKAPRNFKRLIGEDWDYGYLLKLEQYKLKRMAKYFNKSRLVVGWEDQVKTCNLMVSLLDIILEEDSYYLSWLDNSHKLGKFYDNTFPTYVNIRNASRFIINDFPEKFAELRKAELRRQKAWYIYNRLRYLKMENLWD